MTPPLLAAALALATLALATAARRSAGGARPAAAAAPAGLAAGRAHPRQPAGAVRGWRRPSLLLPVAVGRPAGLLALRAGPWPANASGPCCSFARRPRALLLVVRGRASGWLGALPGHQAPCAGTGATAARRRRGPGVAGPRLPRRGRLPGRGRGRACGGPSCSSPARVDGGLHARLRLVGGRGARAGPRRGARQPHAGRLRRHAAPWVVGGRRSSAPGRPPPKRPPISPPAPAAAGSRWLGAAQGGAAWRCPPVPPAGGAGQRAHRRRRSRAPRPPAVRAPAPALGPRRLVGEPGGSRGRGWSPASSPALPARSTTPPSSSSGSAAEQRRLEAYGRG